MPVPSAISDLSTTPASNSPAGSETPSSTDDYLRTLSAFIKQAYDATQSGNTQWCGSSGGIANALTLTPTPAVSAYAAGQVFRFLAATTNTGAVTVAISGLSAIAMQVNGAACVGGEIVSGQWYELVLSSSSVAQLRTTLAPNLTTAINFKRATVAATATATPLWLPSNGNVQDWTGVVAITDLPAAPQPGAQREIHPAAGAIMTHGGNISVQGNASVTAAAGDIWIITAVTTTTFYVVVVPKIPSQRNHTVNTTNISSAVAGTVDTGISVTLPNNLKSTSSKVKITVSLAFGASADGGNTFTLFRDATDLTPSGVNGIAVAFAVSSSDLVQVTFDFTDSPGSITPATYKLYWTNVAGSAVTRYIGRRGADTAFDLPTMMSVEEILG